MSATTPRPDQIALARIQAVVAAPTGDFRALLKIAGRDPRKDLRYHDWSNISFAGADLRNMDFTGARLLNCDFTDALIAGARFERAMIDRVGLGSGPRTDLRKAKDWEAYAKGWKKSSLRPADGHLPEGAMFQDAPFGPEMVVIPAGEFLMGSSEVEAKLAEDDRANTDEIVPGQGKRRMRIVRRFALGRYPVTFDEYDAFLAATAGKRGGEGSKPSPRTRAMYAKEYERNQKVAKLGPDIKAKIGMQLRLMYDELHDVDKADGWSRRRRPVISISWQDAQRYCAWLNRTTGLQGDFGYRLPSESEWEYACRAGTNTRRWWGDKWDPAKANGNRSFGTGRTSAVGGYPANPWGLHDMIGNVWEWCADCWADNISALPADGVPFLHAKDAESSLRVLRGGCWYGNLPNLRSADRNRSQPGNRLDSVGFRVARTLLPPSS